MKEYIVLEIRCKKGINLLDVYSIIKNSVVYNSNLFAIQNLNVMNLSKKSYDLYGKLNLCKFSYKIVLEHLLNTSYYNPEQHDIRMISNLGASWNRSNEDINESLSDQDFRELIVLCDSLRAMDISSLIIGFDQIEWGGEPVCKGTYGFEKADCTYNLGRNYLSNSVVIGRTYEGKQYTAFISCEKRFRDLDIIDKVATSLGEIAGQELYFAPENEGERTEWDNVYEKEKLKFEAVTDYLIKLNPPKAPLIKKEIASQEILKCLEAERSGRIDIQSKIIKYLCNDGWRKRPARRNEWPTFIYKNKGNYEIAFSIVSSHNGHHIQVLAIYSSEKFYFSKNIHSLSSNLILDQEAEELFYKILEARDYFYNAI